MAGRDTEIKYPRFYRGGMMLQDIPWVPGTIQGPGIPPEDCLALAIRMEVDVVLEVKDKSHASISATISLWDAFNNYPDRKIANCSADLPTQGNFSIALKCDNQDAGMVAQGLNGTNSGQVTFWYTASMSWVARHGAKICRQGTSNISQPITMWLDGIPHPRGDNTFHLE